jgi:hypothetical protein
MNAVDTRLSMEDSTTVVLESVNCNTLTVKWGITFKTSEKKFTKLLVRKHLMGHGLKWTIQIECLVH